MTMSIGPLMFGLLEQYHRIDRACRSYQSSRYDILSLASDISSALLSVWSCSSSSSGSGSSGIWSTRYRLLRD